ncbi:BTB/POZ protein [Rhizophagus irregularis DAOM 181602=DAOM 197198]|nr:BTB/POZ protein [Rhizophagus irregularis DAOM 181602=DAOM 197198]
MDDTKLLSKLSQNLLEILNDEEYYDITIEVEIFQIILRYIYGGTISLKEYNITDIIKVLIVANELGLQELIRYLESFLIENQSNWMEQNFDLIYQTSFENNSSLRLQKNCTDLILKEPNKIFDSPKFSSIPENLLVALIQNDNLQMDSFIFTFNNDGIEDYILSRVKNEKKAILNCSMYDGFGPLFGDKDLLLYQTFDNELKVSCEKKDYEKRIRKINDSRVLEFEVFKVQIVYF